jgi:hypothetical protein
VPANPSSPFLPVGVVPQGEVNDVLLRSRVGQRDRAIQRVVIDVDLRRRHGPPPGVVFIHNPMEANTAAYDLVLTL